MPLQCGLQQRPGVYKGDLGGLLGRDSQKNAREIPKCSKKIGIVSPDFSGHRLGEEMLEVKINGRHSGRTQDI